MAAKKPIVLSTSGDLQQMQSGDFLDVTQGGTGAATVTGAQTNLQLVPGTNVQAHSAELDGVAGLTATGIISRTGSGMYASRSIVVPSSGITVTNADGVSGNPTFALANDLAALEGLTGTGFAVRSATDTWVQRQITVSTRLAISNADGVAGNPVIDLAASGVAAGAYFQTTVDSYGRVTGGVNPTTLSGFGITDAMPKSGGTFTGPVTLNADPVNALDAATKQYVDATASGLDAKESVRVLASTNITLSGAQTIDGIAVVAGNRVLATGQTTASQNGIWVVQAGAWTRPTDFNSTAGSVDAGSFTFVEEGTTYAASGWVLQTKNPITVDTTSLSWVQFSGAGEINAGTGITKSGNTLSVSYTARFTSTSGSLDLATTGVTAGTYTKVQVDVYGRVVSASQATASDIGAQPASSELTATANLSTTGLIARTGAGTKTTRTITAPAAGITVTNPDGVAGNPTIALANDLAAVEGLSGTGIPVRTNTDQWTTRTIQGTSGRVGVTNGDGVANNPVIDLATTGVSAGTYAQVTVDAYGRVTSGVAAGSSTTSNLAVPLTNAEAGAINIGQAVYSSGGGSVKKAVANATGTKDVVGLVVDTSVNASANGNIATAGVVTATTAQWDAVTGQTGGLTAGAVYFLSAATAGGLTSTMPATGFVCRAGRALSTTQLEINIGLPIQL